MYAPNHTLDPPWLSPPPSVFLLRVLSMEDPTLMGLSASVTGASDSEGSPPVSGR